MSREEHIKELILYLSGKKIGMCPATKSYWETHYHEIERIFIANNRTDCATHTDKSNLGGKQLGDDHARACRRHEN